MTAIHPIQESNSTQNGYWNDKVIDKSYSRYAAHSETGLDGPDQVLASDVDITTEYDGKTRILLDSNSENSTLPISIPGLLTKIAKKYPDHLALVSRPGVDGTSTTYTYKEYETEIRTVAKAFLKLGLERHYSVCILGFNSPQWFISNIAAIYAGGISAGVYTTNSPEACEYSAINSKANIIVVEDSKQLEKILQIKKNLPLLKAIVQYEGIAKEKDVLNWHDLLEIGRQETDEKLESVLKTIGANECCTLIFTSGTVGNPKAVMLSHDNILHNARSILKTLTAFERKEVIVTYLPLSHIAAQLVDMYASITVAATVHFADKDALKGSLVNTLIVVRPTLFIGVPRVWEKIYEKMQAVARNNGFIKTLIANWAKTQGFHYNMNKMNGVDYKHWGYIIAKWLVFGKVKAALGLDRCRLFITAAAPLTTDIKKYFISLDIPIIEAYGLSECSGAHTLSTPNKNKLNTTGKTLEGLYTKLDNVSDTGEGEICMKGRHVFMGYLNELEKTKEAKDENGWLHSGDIGRIDADGFMYITGRIKELIITSGGENIPPVNIEHLVLSELPALSNAVLIGDKKKYLTILVTLKTDMSLETGLPLDSLTSSTLEWVKSIGSKARTVTDIISSHDPLVYKAIEEAINRANNKAVSNAQKVQKFKILPRDFSISTGEFGPTLKTRRNVIYNMYSDLIEEMYK